MPTPEALMFSSLFETLRNSLRQLPSKPPNFPPFVDYGWKEFNPQVVLEVLSSSVESYAAHRDLLFSGLSTWLLRPGNSRMRRQAMLLVALRQFEEAEEKGRVDFPRDALLSDLYGRSLLVSPSFYADFYNPVGGIKALYQCPTLNSFVKRLRKRSKDLYTVAAIMKVFDYRVQSIPFDVSWYDITENMGFKAVDLIYRAGLLPGQCGKYEARLRWGIFRDRASFIYAASTVICEDKRSLLEVICAGDVFNAPKQDVIHKWVDRSRYAHQVLMMRLPGDAAKGIEHYISMDGMSENPGLPTFSAESISIISTLFSQEKTLAKRRERKNYSNKKSD